MKSIIKVDAAILREALNKSVCDVTAAQPIYRHTLVTRSESGITLTTTDEVMLYEISLHAEVQGELDYTANVSLLKAALAGLEGEVTLQYDGEHLVMRHDRRRYRIDSLPGITFPVSQDEYLTKLDLDPLVLAEAIQTVMYAAPVNNGHWYLNGVHVNQARVVGTDAQALAVHPIETGIQFDMGLIIPSTAFRKKLLSYINENTQIQVVMNDEGTEPMAVCFSDETQYLRVRLLYFKFPDFDKKMTRPENMKFGAAFKSHDMTSALARVIPFAGTKSNEGGALKTKVLIDLSVDGKTLTVQSRDNESAVDFIDCEPSEPDSKFEARFDATLLKNMLSNINGETISWSQSDSQSEQGFIVEDHLDTHYIMPCR